MPRQRRASAGPDLEIVAVRLAADRKLDRLHHGGIAAIAAQHPLEIDRIRLPQARVQHAGGRHTVTRARLQSSQNCESWA
jgi:hypothetical protein